MATIGAFRCVRPHRAQEGRMEREDAAIGGDHPVATGLAIGGHPDNRRIEVHRPGRAVEPGVAVGEEAAVGSDEPVPAWANGHRGDGHRDDRRPVGDLHARHAVHVGDPAGPAGEPEVDPRRQRHREAERAETVDEDRDLSAAHLHRDEVRPGAELGNRRGDRLPPQSGRGDTVDDTDRVRRGVGRARIGRRARPRHPGMPPKPSPDPFPPSAVGCVVRGVGERERQTVGAAPSADRRTEAHVQSRSTRSRAARTRNPPRQLLRGRELQRAPLTARRAVQLPPARRRRGHASA